MPEISKVELTVKFLLLIAYESIVCSDVAAMNCGCGPVFKWGVFDEAVVC